MADDIVSLGGPERPDRFRAGRARVVAIAVSAALVIALPVTAAILASGTARRPDVSVHPASTAVRIPISGVVAVAADCGYLWAVRYVRLPAVRFQLVKVDRRTGKVGRASCRERV